MKTLKACSFLAIALLTPVLGADSNSSPGREAGKGKPIAKKEAKPAPKKSKVAPTPKGMSALNDKQLKEKLEATRKELAVNAKKHEASHAGWIQAKKDAQAVEDEIAKHKKALAELEKKAGATAKKIKALEEAHAATENTEKALKAALATQEKELTKRSEIRKLKEQAAKLKAQAEALEKRAAELR